MEISAISQQLLTAKRSIGVSFAELGQLLGRDEVWVAALCYGQASATAAEGLKKHRKNSRPQRRSRESHHEWQIPAL